MRSIQIFIDLGVIYVHMIYERIENAGGGGRSSVCH